MKLCVVLCYNDKVSTGGTGRRGRFRRMTMESIGGMPPNPPPPCFLSGCPLSPIQSSHEQQELPNLLQVVSCI